MELCEKYNSIFQEVVTDLDTSPKLTTITFTSQDGGVLWTGTDVTARWDEIGRSIPDDSHSHL